MKSFFQSLIGTSARRLCGSLILLAAMIGCRSAAGEVVEAELRDREKQLDELKQELDHRDAEIQGLEAEVQRLKRKAARAADGPVGSVMLVKKINLGRSTGGYDQDPKIPGDEAIIVIVEPLDMNEQTIKAPGCLHIDLFEINPQGLEFLISTWDLSAKEVRNAWDAPLIGSSGYRFILPWKMLPTFENLRVVAQFTTPEGQRFQADKKIAVRLPERMETEQLHPPKPLGSGAIPQVINPKAMKPGERGIFAMPPDERVLTAPPVLAPPSESGVGSSTATTADSDGTSPSPRAKASSASGVSLQAPANIKRIDSK